jgi:hypothetical protein
MAASILGTVLLANSLIVTRIRAGVAPTRRPDVRSRIVSKQTEILDTFLCSYLTRCVLMRAIRRAAREAYERTMDLHEDKPDMDSAGIGRDRKRRRPRARSDASRSTKRLLLAGQGKEWCKLQMAGVPPVIELSRFVFEALR